MQGRRLRLLALAAMLCTTRTGPAVAEEARAIDEKHAGYPYYQQYCASCHGVFADGKGLVAPLLKGPVPDLSRLIDKYGSPLPEAQLAEFIEGQSMPRSHGGAEMPIWGRRLRSDLPPRVGTQQTRRAIIALIVDYLAAIQREPQAATSAPSAEPAPSQP